ncbi:sensor histidine kinase [Actinotalea sp.]|uniref:sensor histidine kinase n=1 Tax=Actinotalea sp. TaxID=1872145 RepID=UPI003565C3F3
MAAVVDRLGPAVARDLRHSATSPHRRVVRLVVAACILLSLPVVLHKVHGHAIMPALDLVLDTTATVVLVTLTTLAWARFRERQVIAAAFHAGAFAALASAYGVAVVVSLVRAPGVGDRVALDSAQSFVFALARLAAASLFVLAGVLTRRSLASWKPPWILAAPPLVVLLTAAVGSVFDPPDVPILFTFPDQTGLPHTTPFGMALHVVTAVLFFVGVSVSRRLWHSEGALIDSWIAIGLVFAGFAELHAAIYPSAHPGQVSLGDMLDLMCSLCLLAGLSSAFRASQRGLRAANAELATLRDSEVERAAIEERSRLARELHDGLAQDLWLAKLRAGEVASTEGLSSEARRAAADALAAIDVGLTHARDAVAALRSLPSSESGFHDLLRRAVEEHAGRFGLRVEFTYDGDPSATIAPKTQVEVLRIVQEALANVTRHAEATVAGVSLVLGDGRIRLRVADNGRGFVVAAAGGAGYGLSSMRERAALVGGTLRVDSTPARGTLITLTAPFTRATARVAVDRS